VYCGVCINCARGNSAQCLSVRPGRFGAAYGYANMGGYQGAQAEYLRVPFADANCIPLPGTPMDKWEDDFVMLADAFVTGWHAAELANVQATATVAVFGAGPIGLLAAYSALLRGAAAVYVVDHVPARLAKAETLGAIPIDFRKGDPVEQIREKRREKGLPPGEDLFDGVDCGIDAVGFQAIDRNHPDQENPRQVIDDLTRLINPGGSLGIAGVYVTNDRNPPPQGNTDGSMTVSWGDFFNKGVSVRFGRTNDRRYTGKLRDLIIAGKAHPGQIVTHRASLHDAPALYNKFALRADGVIKVVFRP
ncbi:MAG: alcohol dehydrogenase, partial [Firmicutes bacterium]|nr:alcohol dehydrogenase [Bacillota bacterium]